MQSCLQKIHGEETCQSFSVFIKDDGLPLLERTTHP